MNYPRLVSILVFACISLIHVVTKAQNPVYYSSSQRTYDRGVELYERGHYNAAISRFEDYLRSDDASHKVWADYYRLTSHLYLFHPNAEQDLVDFTEKNPTHFTSKLTYFQLGKHFYANSKYDKAIKYFAGVESSELSEEERSELNFKLAYSYFSKKMFNKALGRFERSRLRNSKYKAAGAYYCSYIYMENENWPKAIDALEELKQNSSYGKVVPGMLCKAYYNNGDYDKVISYGEPILKKSNSGITSLYVGSAYFDKQDYEKAKMYLKDASPKGRETHYRLGYSYFAAQQYDLAVENLKKAMIPDDSVAQVAAYYLGHSYQNTKRNDLAVTAYKQAYLLDYDKNIEKEALYNYGMLSFETGNYANSIIGLTRYLELYPDDRNANRAREALSDAYLKSDNYEDALKYLAGIRNKSEKIKGAYQNAAFMLAIKYYNCQDFATTESYLDKAFVYTPDKTVKASSYFLKAEMMAQKGDYNQAILNYSGLFQTDQNRQSEYYDRARYGIAHAYYNNKEFTKAAGHYKYYVDNVKIKDDIYYDAVIRLADCQYIKKENVKAAELYERASNESKYLNDYALFQAGIANYFAKNYEESKNRFRTMVRKHPGSGYADNAVFQSGIVNYDIANYQEASNDFGKLINEYPNSELVPFALEKRGIAFSNLGNFQSAKQDFVRIIENYPTHEVAKSSVFSLQESLNRLGQSDEFDKYLAAYKKANPDDNNTETIEYENAKNLFALEKYPRGAQAFSSFIKGYPTSTYVHDARYFMGECYRLEGNKTAAVEAYEQVIKDNKSYYAGRAIYKCADLYYALDSMELAKTKYQLLLDYSTKNKDKVRGYKGLMNCEFALGNYEQSVWRANDLINKTSVRSRDLHGALITRAKSKFALEQDSSALQDLDQVRLESKTEQGAEAAYLSAEYHYKNKNYERSIELLRQLNENFASFDKWLGKSFLLIADNYIALDERYQAKATLVSLKEKSEDPEIVEAATNKLDFLEQEDQSIGSDTLFMEEGNIPLQPDSLTPDTTNNE